MRQKFQTVFLFSIASLVTSDALHGQPAVLHVSVSARELVLRGVTPGARVVLFGLSGETVRGILTKEEHVDVLADTDRDGVITFAPRHGIPFRSIWVAADLASGASAVATPEGYQARHHALPSRAIKKDVEGFIAALELERRDVTVLLVRPGVGAWRLHGREGEWGDGDHVPDGRLTLILGDAEPVGDGKEQAPKKLKAGDFVAALDRGRFDLRTLAVTK